MRKHLLSLMAMTALLAGFAGFASAQSMMGTGFGCGMMGGMMGPGMMGPMGGWRGFRRQEHAEEMPINPKQALGYAQMFLDSYVPGTKVVEDADRFYGYYTIHVLRENRIYGMLSVNGFTGIDNKRKGMALIFQS